MLRVYRWEQVSYYITELKTTADTLDPQLTCSFFRTLCAFGTKSLDTVNHLIDMDVDAVIRNFRPDSAYNVVFITNIEYFVFITDFPLRGSGGGEYNMPHYLEESHAEIQGLCI